MVDASFGLFFSTYDVIVISNTGKAKGGRK